MSIKLKDTIYDLINNSDKLDGKDSSAFSLTTHIHDYLPLSGGRVNGRLIIGNYIGFDSFSDGKEYLLGQTNAGAPLQFYDGSTWHTLIHSGNYTDYTYSKSQVDSALSGFITASQTLSNYNLSDNTNKLLSQRVWSFGTTNKGDQSAQSENPTMYGMYISLQYNSSKNMGFQIYGDTWSAGDLYTRYRNAGDGNTTYSAWRKILDETNYSSYALPLSGGTISGPLYFGGSVYHPYISIVGSGYVSVDSFGSEISIAGGNNNHLHINYRPTKGGFAPTEWYLRAGSGSSWANFYAGKIYASGREVWHGGNFNPSNYLPLSGGTLSTSERVVLNLKSSDSYGAILGFQKSDETIISNIGHIPNSATSAHGAFWTNNEANIGFILGSDGIAYVTTNSNSLSPKYKIWHSGNSNLSSVDWNASKLILNTTNTTDWNVAVRNSAIQLLRTGDTAGNAPYSYCSGISIMTSYTGFQLASHGGSSNEFYFRSVQDDGAWLPWRTVAFTDSNVASATKLQTARTIWGQPFDGTGNITGTLTIPAIGGGDGRYVDMNYNGYSLHGANGGWAMGMNVYLNNGTFKGQICGAFGDASSLGYFYYGGEYNNASMYITSNKNVGIGTNSPAYKLDVNGNGRFNKYLVIGASLGQSNTARAQLDLVSPDANPCDFYLGADNTKYWSITSRNNADATFSGKGLGFYDAVNSTYRMCITQSGNVGIGTTSPTHPLQIYKSSTTNGDMIRLDSNSSWCGIVYRPSGGYVWSLNAGNPNTFNFWNNYIGGNAMEIKQTGSLWVRSNVTAGGFYNKNGDSAQTSSYMWGLYQWGNKIQMTRRNASTEAYESLLYEINIDTKDITFSNNVTVSGSCNVSTLKIGGETITFTT